MSYGFNNYSSLGLTLGLAALGLAAYSLRHQEARAFAWIRNRLGTTRTIDSVGRGTLETFRIVRKVDASARPDSC